MIKIYFVRHGETDYNKRGIVQGSGVDSDLNETGQAQAKAFFETYKEIEFDQIFVSELKRTHQTMEPWYNMGYDFSISRGLNEFSWGIHEGVVPTTDQRAEFQGLLKQWGEGKLDLSVEAGESPISAWDRAQPFFSEVMKGQDEATYLMCSHGRQLRIIISQLLGQDMRLMERYKHSNTGLSVLHLNKATDGTLELLNSVHHLNQLEIGS